MCYYTCCIVKQSPTDVLLYMPPCEAVSNRYGILHATLRSSLQQMWYYTCCTVKQSPTDVLLYMPPCEAVSNRYISPKHHKFSSPSSSIIAELHCLSFRILSCSALLLTPGQEIVTFLAPGISPRFQCHFFPSLFLPNCMPAKKKERKEKKWGVGVGIGA